LNLAGHDQVSFSWCEDFEKKPIRPALSSDRQHCRLAFRSQAHETQGGNVKQLKVQKESYTTVQGRSLRD
jgi:hypothetical protein